MFPMESKEGEPILPVPRIAGEWSQSHASGGAVAQFDKEEEAAKESFSQNIINNTITTQRVYSSRVPCRR